MLRTPLRTMLRTPLRTPLRILCWIGMVAFVGCSKTASNPPAADSGQTSGKTTPTGGAPVVGSVAEPTNLSGLEASQLAKKFLNAVQDGTATADQMTPSFKKIIAEPVFETDRARGYSDSVAENWLKQFQGKLGSYAISSPTIHEAAYYTGTVSGAKPQQLLLRVKKAESGWLVDWFSVVEATPVQVPGEPTAQTFASMAFLHALIGHKDELAAGTMSTAYKKSIAPAIGSETKPYNAGTLKTKLNGIRANFTGFKLIKTEGGTVTGQLLNAETSKSFTLKLVMGEQNEWLVDEVRVD